MDASIFMDKSVTPDSAALSTALGKSFALWEETVRITKELYPALIEEWAFPGSKHGWSFRLKDKKRVLIYLLPREKYFMIAMVFGEKACAEVKVSTIADHIKAMLAEARPYAEGRGVRVAIRERSGLDDIRKMLEIKLRN